jgi:Na+-transporting NADH:ubiquinone oxidoreductase subunit F
MILINITFIIAVSVAVFMAIIAVLVGLLLFAKAKLSSSGPVKISINGEKEITVEAGSSLLSTLSSAKIYLPSACGGGGTCAMCKCQVLEGGGEILPTEAPYFSRKQIQDNWRLGCQVKVKQDMVVHVPEEVFGIKEWEAEVVSNYNVATYIKEFVVQLPEDMHYEAGGYIQIKIPKCVVKFADMDVSAHPKDHPGEPAKFEKDWSEGPFAMRGLVMKNEEEVIRAYSMASYPAEGRLIMLNVRVAAPPFDRANNKWADINPGIASSYIFNLKPGDKAVISGPYGEFFIKETGSEMLYIGGGAGMAPMRSHIYHLFKTLKTGRKVTYWYGGRSRAELFYIHYFREIEAQFPNFKFYMVLSDAKPEDNWVEKKDTNDTAGDGFVGFVHNQVIKQYLSKHEAPEDIEFYFCGPPMMNAAILKMCDDWGVPKENVSFDDFGS